MYNERRKEDRVYGQGHKEDGRRNNKREGQAGRQRVSMLRLNRRTEPDVGGVPPPLEGERV